MKKLFLILLIPVLTALSAHAQTLSYHGVRQDIVIDVRTSAEFAAGHINGAVNIPLERIDADIHSVPGITRNSRILLYCRSGQRSGTAAVLLEKQGFRQVLNGGGIKTLQTTLKACTSQYC